MVFLAVRGRERESFVIGKENFGLIYAIFQSNLSKMEKMRDKRGENAKSFQNLLQEACKYH